MDRGAWWAAVHGVAKSRIRLSDFTFTFHFQALEKEMATHSSILAWRIPGMGAPGGLPSMRSHRVRHDWSELTAAAAGLTHDLNLVLLFHSRLFSQTLHLLPRKTNQIPKNPSFVKGKSYLCFYKKQSYKNMKRHKLRWSCIKHFHFFFLGERSNMETFLAISFSNAWNWKVKVKSLSRIRLLATPWTAAYQAPPSMGFSRQKYWSGVPFPSPSSSLSSM